jgi:hypothetical protein
MKMCAGLVMACLLLASVAATAQTLEQTRQYENALSHSGRLDLNYVKDENIVRDYHHYHLRKPQDGYEWVHYIADLYVLISVKTGVIEWMEQRPNIPPESPAGK